MSKPAPQLLFDGEGATIRMLPIECAPGYFVTDHGEIYSRVSTKDCWSKKLRLRTDRDGYKEIELSVGTKRKVFRVHRLVALAFIGPPPEGKPEVRHKDGNPSNNLVGNLQWGSHQENMHDRQRHGRDPVGEKNGRSKLDDRKVARIRRLAIGGAPLAEIARRYRVSASVVDSVADGGTWQGVEPAAEADCAEELARILGTVANRAKRATWNQAALVASLKYDDLGTGDEILGKRCGRLRITAHAGVCKFGHAQVECVCDCGKTLVIRLFMLRQRRTRSCGCLRLDLAARRAEAIAANIALKTGPR